MTKHSHAAPPYGEPGYATRARDRVNYFYGQLLGVRELQAEQRYFLDKHRLHNRYLHGYGVVCGLEVKLCPRPRDPHDPDHEQYAPDHEQHAPDHEQRAVALGPRPQDLGQAAPELGQRPLPQDRLDIAEQRSEAAQPREAWLEIDRGIAIDCLGNEIVVPWLAHIDILGQLDEPDRRELLLGSRLAYISLCFSERPLELVRPFVDDSCRGVLPDCVPSRLRDDYYVRVSLDQPAHDLACTSCERPCGDPALPLAAVRWEKNGLQIEADLRRPLAPFVPTRIVGVSWAHGGSYAPTDVDAMLREGLVIRFSDEVYASTLGRAVIEAWIIEGGDGRRGDIYNADITIAPEEHATDPTLCRAVRAHVRAQRNDRLDPGDRVLIQLRSGFVLDRCCRPVDGEHVGGLVPVIKEYEGKWAVRNPDELPKAPCHHHEPRARTPWVSGNGSSGGNFESWFFVHDDHQRT
ncbi:MAG TPA: hypothetical protein VNO30_41500 [Kofleriaceae bacterium]|nr:hypothetical protein [Kofleriaceae bacterium]